MQDNKSPFFDMLRAINQIESLQETTFREWAMWTKQNY